MIRVLDEKSLDYIENIKELAEKHFCNLTKVIFILIEVNILIKDTRNMLKHYSFNINL